MQRPLPDGALEVVLRGPKQNGDGELVNLAGRARVPHKALPLPLFVGETDRLDNAATVAVEGEIREIDDIHKHHIELRG